MNMASVIVLDTMLLVLFVVGTTNPNLIARHKRLEAYTVDDFQLLHSILAEASDVVVTPNTLTEASNLLGYIDEPARGLIFYTFREIIRRSTEHHIRSREAADRAEFMRLGLTDAVSLEAAASRSLLTADLELYLAALDRRQAVMNFNHLREAAQGL